LSIEVPHPDHVHLQIDEELMSEEGAYTLEQVSRLLLWSVFQVPADVRCVVDGASRTGLCPGSRCRVPAEVFREGHGYLRSRKSSQRISAGSLESTDGLIFSLSLR